ncbi:type II secretion system F family protein [Streptomyces sp. NPDC002588]|uniref:type II secretion system F family protein n=1 Tax=Streptomyces sp. NPDC002588 TaxID=3154419 RepID=UPI00332B1C74
MSTEVVHRLGAAVGIALAVGAVAHGLGRLRHERRARRRTAELLAPGRAPDPPRGALRDAVREWLPAAAVTGVGWVVIGGITGIVAGAAGAVGLWRLRRRRDAADPVRQADARLAARQLPLAADLLSACIVAGAGPVLAAQAVGEALGGPVGEGLARGAAEVRLGGEPATAWRRLASAPGAEALARLLEQAGVTGLPASGPVARLAADTRADWTRAATARARRAAVMVAAPVGLCFLPAFIAIGVLPVVIGLAGGAMGGGGP